MKTNTRLCGSKTTGFSLIELAIVLVIVGLLVGGGITALITTSTQARRNQQKNQMEDIRTALYGFAMTNGRLPCPDTSGDGKAQETCSGGDTIGGRLPWATLGLGRRDAWGNPLRYRVDKGFTGTPLDADEIDEADTEEEDDAYTSDSISGFSAFDFYDDGHLEVNDGDGDAVVQNTAAVVVAFGPQGGQVWSNTDACSSSNTKGFSPDEIENCDQDAKFVVSDYRRASAQDGRFDDIVMWLPTSVLIAQMVNVDRLPRTSHGP